MTTLLALAALVPKTFPSDVAESPYADLFAAGKALLPLAGYLAMAPVLWWFFHKTWRELDVEAHAHRQATIEAGKYDLRPAVLFTITALVLTMQEYYGGRDYYGRSIQPILQTIQSGASMAWLHGAGINLSRYNDLYGFGWWTFTRVAGYVLFPFAAWKLIFPKDKLLDMGLRTRGMRQHLWIYALCLVVVMPAVFIVAHQPDFGSYYPFYKLSSRSWVDFLAWEAMYVLQFFALEIFFRGFWLSGLRTTLGSGAIFAMCVPYCMIHFGKPYLEAAGAVIAGVALGSLAMRTKSIYAGFAVHVGVALTMDITSLINRSALPTSLWGP